MSVVITAVPSAPGAVDSPAALAPPSERPLTDFVAGQSGAGMGQLANPAALASELFGSLRGYVERTQIHEKALRRVPGSRADGNDDARVAVAVAGEPRADLHGGPARESLEPAEPPSGRASGAAGVSMTELQRAEQLALEAMKFMLETNLVVGGTKQTTGSVQNLLKGQ